MTMTLTEYLAQRGERTTYQDIIDLDQHRCDYANCDRTAEVLVTARVYRGAPARQTGIIELRGVCAKHAHQFGEGEADKMGIRPTATIIS